MIGDRDHRDIGLKRAKAIWTFRSTDLVEALWEWLDDRRSQPDLDSPRLLDDIAAILAGDDMPPLRTIDPPRLRPAVPPNGHPGRGTAEEPGS